MGLDRIERFLAFRFREGELQPVEKPSIPDFHSLLHIDAQKEILRRNTHQLVAGLPANDALLWGKGARASHHWSSLCWGCSPQRVSG